MTSKLTIGTYPYTVEQVEDLKDAKGNDLFGEHDALGQKLLQRAGLTPDRAMTNLWHEIFHAILDQVGLHYLVDNPDLIEAVNIALASGVHQVLRDNPELVAKYRVEQQMAQLRPMVEKAKRDLKEVGTRDYYESFGFKPLTNSSPWIDIYDQRYRGTGGLIR